LTSLLASHYYFSGVAVSVIDQLEPILHRAALIVQRNAGPTVLNAGASVKFETHEPSPGVKLAIAAITVTFSIAYGQDRVTREKRSTCNRITPIEF
jgi:hypothetical protein